MYGTGHVKCFVEVEVVEVRDRRGWGLCAQHAGLGPERILDKRLKIKILFRNASKENWIKYFS
jgi:hypothetical protein